MRTKISVGNSKTGAIPAVSLPPVISCRPDAPCKSTCYALKSFRMYPAVKSAWTSNLDHYKTNQEKYFSDISEYLSKKKKPVRFFRFHVSGDIVDMDYFSKMVGLCADHPETVFLAFTKQYSIVNNWITENCFPEELSIWPTNVTIVFSAWPGFAMDNPYKLPVAFMQDGTENRVENAIECPGNCESCGMCWQLPALGKNVVFNKH